MSKENENREDQNDKEKEVEDSKDEETTEDSEEQEDLDERFQEMSKADLAKQLKKAEATIVKSKKEEKKSSEDKKPRSKENDLAKKAYLRAEGIDREDFELVDEYVNNTGKDIDEVLDSKYFKQELEERREQRKAENGAPSGSNRSGESPKNKVDYWIEKGELPPKGETELRRKVIAEKEKRSSQGGKGKFYNS